MQRLSIVVLAAWAGGLWTICGIVAPSLFRLLPDRSTAGLVAGHFFTVATWMSVACGILTLCLQLRSPVKVRGFDRALLAVAMIAPATSEFGLRSLMDAARAAGNMSRFGLLHGVSALLFGLACIALAMALWRTTGQAAK